MKIKHKTLDFGKKPTTEIMWGSCAHIGNPSTHYEGLANFIKDAKRKPWLFTGDMIEGVMPHDKRFDVNQHKQTTLANMADAQSFIAQAKDTCWGISTGNHEWKASAMVGNVTEAIAANTGVDYLSITAYIYVVCPLGKFKIFVAHGRGNMNANSCDPEADHKRRISTIRKMFANHDADIKIGGHFHRTIIAPRVSKYIGMLSDDASKFLRRPKLIHEAWAATAPSFFTNYNDEESYAEMGLMAPTDLGWCSMVVERNGNIPCVRSYDEKGRISQEVYPLVLS